MLKHVAIRLKKADHAHIGFSQKHARIINSFMEKRDPALKNLAEGLYNKGLKFSVDGCNLYWYQIDDDRSTDFYAALNEVECVFSSAWFEAEKDKIRHMAGTRYFDACTQWADNFLIKSQHRRIDYDASLQRVA